MSSAKSSFVSLTNKKVRPEIQAKLDMNFYFLILENVDNGYEKIKDSIQELLSKGANPYAVEGIDFLKELKLKDSYWTKNQKSAFFEAGQRQIKPLILQFLKLGGQRKDEIVHQTLLYLCGKKNPDLSIIKALCEYCEVGFAGTRDEDDNKDAYPLSEALRVGNKEVVKILRSYGADENDFEVPVEVGVRKIRVMRGGKHSSSGFYDAGQIDDFLSQVRG
jgi:acid phosphatase class B